MRLLDCTGQRVAKKEAGVLQSHVLLAMRWEHTNQFNGRRRRGTLISQMQQQHSSGEIVNTPNSDLSTDSVD